MVAGELFVFNFGQPSGLDTSIAQLQIRNYGRGKISAALRKNGCLVLVMPAPAEHKGHAQVCVISTETQMKSSIVKVADTYDYQAVTLSQCARYAVYASADGIYFYVMDMESHTCVQTVCRGSNSANVMSMCLVQIDPANKNSWVLAVTSDRGTTHMFAIDKIQDGAQEAHPYQNVTSKLGMMSWSSLVGGIAAEYSFGQFRLPT